MARAIHRFQTILLIFTSDPEDILFILEIMARNFPKLGAINVGADDFTVTSNFVFLSH